MNETLSKKIRSVNRIEQEYCVPFIPEKDVKEKLKDFLEDIKTICPNTLFNKEVDEKALKHFGDKLK